MAYKRTLIFSAFAAVALFVLFYFDLIKEIPGFQCESFGCIGIGLFMVLSPLLVAVLFFVGGIIAAKERRWRTGFLSAGIAFAFAALAVGAIIVLNKIQVNRAVAEACREDPATYCPHTLAR